MKKSMSATRKEKSRNAARYRRSNENEQYQNLANLLPFPKNVICNLDKVSIIRLVVNLLKYKQLTGRVWNCLDATANFHFMKALNGFILVLGSDKKILYISPSVFEHIHINQLDMIGRNISNYIHPDDQGNFDEILHRYFTYNNPSKTKDSPTEYINKDIGMFSTSLRMRCLLNTKSRSKTATPNYMVVNVSGHFIPSNPTLSGLDYLGLVGIVQPLPTMSVCGSPVIPSGFIHRCKMDLVISYCEEQVQRFSDYTAEDLVGADAYAWIHPDDVPRIQVAHRELLRSRKAQTETYRFLNKYGGWIRLTSRAIYALHKKNGGEQTEILCINYIQSGIEHEDLVINDHQKYNIRLEKKRKQKDTHQILDKQTKTSSILEQLLTAERPEKKVMISAIPTEAKSSCSGKTTAESKMTFARHIDSSPHLSTSMGNICFDRREKSSNSLILNPDKIDISVASGAQSIGECSSSGKYKLDEDFLECFDKEMFDDILRKFCFSDNLQNDSMRNVCELIELEELQSAGVNDNSNDLSLSPVFSKDSS